MKKIKIVLVVILLAVFAFSTYKVVSYYLNQEKEQSYFDDLANEVGTSYDNTAESSGEILPQYKSLYEKNSDLFGWLKIDGTVINYPVMHTPEDEEFYLHRAFDKSYSENGTLFLSGNCHENCANFIVYGHNMKSGNMFGTLTQYSRKSYWEKHKTITFDTLYEKGEYEILAAFYSKIGDEFQYYRYTDLTDEEFFNAYISQVEKVKLYDTGVEVQYGDDLLTLSTCSYHTTDGRFIVIARKCKI